MDQIKKMIEAIDKDSFPLKMSNILSRPETEEPAYNFALFTPWQIQ
jgi:hypothetical protein